MRAVRIAKLALVLACMAGIWQWRSSTLAKVSKREAENRLRRRVRRVLSVAGLDQVLPHEAMLKVEDQIMDLFQEYSEAPERSKKEVYKKGERRILQTLRT
jgi:hypothetical protein